MNSQKTSLLSRLAVAGVVSFVTLSSFADQTWKGTSDNLWNTTGNWSGGAIPGSTDIVIYNSNSTANLSNQLTTVFSIKGIAFTNPAGPVSINSANTLTTGASGINMTNATQMLTIAAPVALSANQTWVVATNQSLTVSGAVSGSSTIFKDGPGILYLNGANTWTGNVTNNGGQIWINNSAGLGVGSKLIYVAANNVGVHLNGTNGNISLANNISWTASDSAGAIVNEAGNNTVAGPINVFSGGGAPYFVANAGSLTLSGTITLGTTGRPMTLGGAAAGIDTGGINSAALAVQKTDAGTWTLSAHNAYGGITTISNGTLALVSCNSY